MTPRETKQFLARARRKNELAALHMSALGQKRTLDRLLTFRRGHWQIHPGALMRNVHLTLLQRFQRRAL
jgi:hypothetical protein